jgi:simple sugar transport system ATP-binding protein
METINAIEMRGVTKTFGSVIANKNVDLDIRKGEILSILGENGSGKTTLMNMLAGIYFPDEGKISVNGEDVIIKSPMDAYKHKIGMIHQHFKLVDVFTACDNIILGERFVFEKNDKIQKIKNGNDGSPKAKFLAALKYCALPFLFLTDYVKFDYLKRSRAKKLQAKIDKYGFNLDLSRKIYSLSVSEKQTVEIIKVLYRGADILILDEPTAVLTPQEIEKLFGVLKKMRDDGKSIVIITHKLNEVMAISDRVAVLRKGEHVATVNTRETNEKALTEMMVGAKIELNIKRTTPQNPRKRLEIKNLVCRNRDGLYALNGVSFTAYSGEILGIAGIAGSGQRELLESIAGLNKIDSGDIVYFDPKKNDESVDLRQKNPTQIRDLGVRLSFVPEDRLGMGLVGNMDLTDNMMLRSYRSGHSLFLDRKTPHSLAENIVSELEVSTPSVKTPVRRLSGGNVQKVLVGREIAAAPTVLMAAYPVRGLDINSSYLIYNLLNAQKEKEVAVVFVGEDLDVLLALSDRIIVLCGGRISGIVDARNCDKEHIGLLMTSMPQEVSIFDEPVALNSADNDKEDKNNG